MINVVLDPITDPNFRDFRRLFDRTRVVDVLKRRALYFLIPSLVVATVGLIVVSSLPAIYLSEGKILVESQRIPTDLVRPTVASSAPERIQVLQQRLLTRDNVMALVDKFRLFESRRSSLSNSDVVELVRQRTSIQPIELSIGRTSSERPATVFTVGFKYEDPSISARVAGEYLTLLLSEDLKGRTSRASETTKFLAREVARLQSDLSVADGQTAELQRTRVERARAVLDTKRAAVDKLSEELGRLKAERLVKANKLTIASPEVQDIQRRITSLERAIAPAAGSTTELQETDPALDAAQARQSALQRAIDEANQKLAAARLGETLERDQQAERLEILEQPTIPLRPVSPKRTSLAVMVLLLAVGMGVASAAGTEMLDTRIRGRDDLIRLIEPRMIVAFPLTETRNDRALRTTKRIKVVASLILIFAVVVSCAYFLSPPPEVLWAEIVSRLPTALSNHL